MTVRAIDCQGFAGGFTLGVVQSGFTLIAKREMQAGFGAANCEANRQLLGYQWDTEKLDPVQWSVPEGGAELVFGNPPCSGFSGLSSKDFRGMNSPINHCMWAFVEYVARVRPLVAVFESVRAAYTKGHPLMRDLRARLEARTGLAWTLHHVVHDAYALGGPAIRKRYFWVVSRIPFGVEHPELPVEPTLRDAIVDLENLQLQWEWQPYSGSPSTWARRLRSFGSGVDGHYTPSTPHSRRVTDLATACEWPEGKNLTYITKLHYETYGKLPDSWLAAQENILKRNFEFGFSSNTARWTYDRPARVITGAGPLVAVHPTQPRTFTHREVARIMGFPDDWHAEPLRGVSGVGSTWGKGITVDAGRWIARWVRSCIEGRPGSLTGTVVGNREYEVAVTRPRIRDTVDTALVPVARTQGGAVTAPQPPTDPPAPPVPTPVPEAPAPAPVATPQAPSPAPEPQAATPTAPVAENAESAAQNDGSSGRGRPRPQAAIARDDAIFAVLDSQGYTKDQVADLAAPALTELGVPDDKRVVRTYQSLVRLMREGRAERIRNGREHAWRRATAGTAAPAA